MRKPFGEPGGQAVRPGPDGAGGHDRRPAGIHGEEGRGQVIPGSTGNDHTADGARGERDIVDAEEVRLPAGVAQADGGRCRGDRDKSRGLPRVGGLGLPAGCGHEDEPKIVP